MFRGFKRDESWVGENWPTVSESSKGRPEAAPSSSLVSVSARPKRSWTLPVPVPAALISDCLV